MSDSLTLSGNSSNNLFVTFISESLSFGKSTTANFSLNASSPSVSNVSTMLPKISDGVLILSKSVGNPLNPSLSNFDMVEYEYASSALYVGSSTCQLIS